MDVKNYQQSPINYEDHLTDADFDDMRKMLSIRKANKLKKEKQEQAHQTTTANKKNTFQMREKVLFATKPKKPVNFTFNNQGKIMFKKKVAVENFPE